MYMICIKRLKINPKIKDTVHELHHHTNHYHGKADGADSDVMQF